MYLCTMSLINETMLTMLQGREWPLAVNILGNQGYTAGCILNLEKIYPIELKSACKERLLMAQLMEEHERNLIWGRGNA